MNFSSEMWGAVVTIFAGIIGIAALSVFFSKNATTVSETKAAFGGLSQALNAAEAPILNSGNTSGSGGGGLGVSIGSTSAYTPYG